MTLPYQIVDFWLNDVGPEGWYTQSDALDATIIRRFSRAWRAAGSGAFDHWLADPEQALALLILLDQFPRNMFRGSDRSFATDAKARRLARRAIGWRHDLKIPEPGRQFFYLPLMHSESVPDQDDCIRLINARAPRLGRKNIVHAHVHREEIRRFGRFPGRNAARGLTPTAAERAYHDAGGYGALLTQLGG